MEFCTMTINMSFSYRPVNVGTSKSKGGRTLFRTICVFCGSSSGNRPEYENAARELGAVLAQADIGLVYGGGRVGLMGTLADSVLKSGGHVTGVIPRSLVDREVGHTGLTHLHIVDTMHERKALMADLADAFVLLPGGFGSWDEFCEIVTWSQLGIHQKPMGILNVAGYYDDFLSMSARAVAEGFVKAAHNDIIVIESEAERLIQSLLVAPVVKEGKWITGSER
jgi:uncharacterized protein (TIGR00730 family)